MYRKEKKSAVKVIFTGFSVFLLLMGAGVGGMFLNMRVSYVDGEPSYSRITTGVYHVYAQPQEYIEGEIEPEIIIPKKTPEEIRTEQIERLNKKLGGELANRGADFVRFSEERKMDPYLMAAISIHETGNGTSKAIKERKNVGGIMLKDGMNLRTFISVTSGIEHMIHLLYSEYFNGRNHRTIAQIGAVYCPIGVKNDPTGLNKNWVPRVTELYRELSGGIDYVYRE